MNLILGLKLMDMAQRSLGAAERLDPKNQFAQNKCKWSPQNNLTLTGNREGRNVKMKKKLSGRKGKTATGLKEENNN